MRPGWGLFVDQTVTTPPEMLKVEYGPGPHTGPGMLVINWTVWSVGGAANEPVFIAVAAGGVSNVMVSVGTPLTVPALPL